MNGSPDVVARVEASAGAGPRRLIDRPRESLRLSRRQEHLALVVVWVALTAWVWRRLDQGWVAHDDGAFAQSATRVLDGQLPHREFAELYTGGMTFLNAAMFRLFGEDLIVLRYPLFAVFLGLVPAAYVIARTVSGPWTALLTAVLVATWSIPVYPAAVPSWYLLMFSIYGAVCLLRWRETASDRWLLAAGAVAGIAVTFKIVGLYFALAGLLFLLFVHPRAGAARRLARVDWESICALGLVGALLASVLGSRFGAPELVNLAIPVAAVALAAVAQRAWGGPLRSTDVVVSSVRRSVGLFLGALALPVAVLLLPYVATGSVGDLVEGVFLSPQSRRDAAYWQTPAALSIIFALALAGVMFARSRLSRAGRRLVELGIAATAVAAIALAAYDSTAYLGFWVVGRGMGPLIVFVGAALLVRGWRRSDPARREIVFLLVALVALTSLVQFPFGIPLYYCYVAPLVALAVVGVVGRGPTKDEWALCVVIGAFGLYGAAYLDRASFNTLAVRFERDPQVEVLDRERASIRVDPAEARATREIVELLRRHSRGRDAFVGPDLPHVYFLADLRNPTRSLFDFLDTTHSARGTALLQALRERRITAIAINREPGLSPPLDAWTLTRLARMYPQVRSVSGVDVRWAG